MANEKRLIDANEFVKHFWQRVHDGEIVTLMDAEHAIINAPTVDAVEVVFCDECTNHGHCIPEDTFRLLRIEKPFCCVGGRKTNTNCKDGW